jgi:hypothetical protein
MDEEAVRTAEDNRLDRAMYLNNLSNWYTLRYESTSSSIDLELAINKLQDCLVAVPEGHPERATYLNNMALRTATASEDLNERGNLDKAIELSNEVVDSALVDHPLRAAYLYNNGDLIRTRYERHQSPEDFCASVSAFRKSFNMKNAGPLLRTRSGWGAANC